MTVAADSQAAERADHLAGAPESYGIPATRPTLAQAQAWCRRLATSHYENFHVATWFMPRHVRPYFESIYAFSRVADDLGDEVPDPATATRLLDQWRVLLDQCYDHPSTSMHPVFVALRQTIDETQAPRELFADLIRAFQLDQTQTHYQSLAMLCDYSRYSANPVGRLVLWVSGYREQDHARLSDKICTALQLVNFWQDVVEDHERGRRYIPSDQMQRFGVTDEMIANRRFTPEFRAMMVSLVDHARAMLEEGSAIRALVDRELAITLWLFEHGGQAALDGIAAQQYNVLQNRPSVSKSAKAHLLFRAFAFKAHFGSPQNLA